MGISATIAAVGAVNAKISHDNAKRAEEEQKRRAEQARRDAIADQKRAREAEVFAETEGKGTGTLGTIQSGISRTVDDRAKTKLKQGKSSALRI